MNRLWRSFKICWHCGSRKRKFVTNSNGDKKRRCAKCGSRLSINGINQWRIDK